MRVHGWSASSPGVNGKFHFAVICLLRAIELAQAFLGRNKYSTLKPWTRKEAARFLLTSGKLQDTFWKLDRAAELLDIARTKFVDFQPPSATIEQVVATQQAHRDVPLYLDNVLIYLKIFADCLANLTSQLYDRKDIIPCFSFREQKRWFIEKKPTFDPQYAEILKNQTNWFTTLAGDSDEEGLRELIIHRMARMQIFYQPGKVPDENQVHTFLYGDVGLKVGSLLPTVQKLVDELCIFLDSYFDHFSKRVELQFGGRLPHPFGTVLFEFEGRLASAWLYPQIR
jgi:hypothetical protein